MGIEERTWMMEIFVLIFLLGNTWSDIRKKEILPGSVLLLALAGILNGVLLSSQEGWRFLLGAIPGIVIIFFSVISNQKIGMGDGLAIGAIGLVLGFYPLLEVLTIAMMFTFFWAAFLFLWKKEGRDTAFPLLPFLLLGYIGGWTLWKF